MNIYELLENDHDNAKKILASIKSRKDLKPLEELRKEVYIHNEAEEEAFYEPLQGKVGKLKMLVKAGHDEHDLVIKMMDQLSKIESDEDWMILFSAIKKSLESHILMEEEDIFTLSKKHFSDSEAKEMATEMEKLKKKMNKSYDA